MATSRRQDRLAERVKEEASQVILHELHDPRMGFVTVIKVKLSSDLVMARIFVSIMGTDAERNRTLTGGPAERVAAESVLENASATMVRRRTVVPYGPTTVSAAT